MLYDQYLINEWNLKIIRHSEQNFFVFINALKNFLLL